MCLTCVGPIVGEDQNVPETQPYHPGSRLFNPVDHNRFLRRAGSVLGRIEAHTDLAGVRPGLIYEYFLNSFRLSAFEIAVV